MNGHSHEEADETGAAAHGPQGLSLDADGFVLAEVGGPSTVGEQGALSFRIVDAAGEAVTEFTTSHDRELHLIVVRSDGADFRHVHPELDVGTGTWTIPWAWQSAGTFRVYADFTPAGAGARGLTLTRTIDVAGAFSPVAAEPRRVAEVDGFTVTLDGALTAGAPGELTATVESEGRPVQTLEPYLGAFGHLVALRQGDLAFLHVHPEGDEPEQGDTGGPQIRFIATAPTAGRYLLYLDFQVDGQVHTASFVVDAAHGDAAHNGGTHGDETGDGSHGDGH